MVRFLINRTWALILALLLGVASVATIPALARATADPNANQLGGDIVTPTNPDDHATGDPDAPTGAGRSTPRPNYSIGRSGMFGVSGASASTLSRRDEWVVRVRVALELLKIYNLRF